MSTGPTAPIKEKKLPVRPYRVVHQLLGIKSINFSTKSFVGCTELTILPLRDFDRILINSRGSSIYKVYVKDHDNDLDIEYRDPLMEVCDEATGKDRSVESFSSAYFKGIKGTDPDRKKSEVTIMVPKFLNKIIMEGKEFKLCIEYSVENPVGGIHFCVPEGEGSHAERGSHMYTYGFENSSRLWFPCVDVNSEPCTWELELTVDNNMTAVATGELMETVYNPDMKKKTFHYEMKIPTPAPNVGLAVGPFTIYMDKFMPEVTHFCLPKLKQLMKDSVSFLHEVFEFYEFYLNSRYPFTCYKQVFVHEAPVQSRAYSGLGIFDMSLLHTKHIIDQTYETRKVLSRSLAEQFFGCYISHHTYSDAWLTRGMAGFLGAQYVKKAFGNNEYRLEIQRIMEEVIEYEEKFGAFVLDPWHQKPHENLFYFSNRSLQTLSPLYYSAYTKKAILIIRMLRDKMGESLMTQVFTKLMTLAGISAQQKITINYPNNWNNLMISTDSFSRVIFVVTGMDIAAFLRQWVFKGGHAKLSGSFIFNRKRNTVELEIKQLDTMATGVIKYMGPLTIWIQELDGSFPHTLQIEETATKHDITCHSKSRRNKKKKIPLCTLEEVDMDLTSMDQDSPVLWIRIDPDMQLLRKVMFEQPDYQWQYQLRWERDVTAQMEAIQQLKRFPTNHSKSALADIIENDKCFYRIRCEATIALKEVANMMASSFTGPTVMIYAFKKMFGSYSCPHIIKMNNFENFQMYFLQSSLPIAIAGLRTSHKICPSEVTSFLFDLFKYNDNSKNKFSDNYYRASLITALGNTVTPAVTAVLRGSLSQENLSSETKLILEEICRCLNLDKMLPCYKNTVSVSCLKAIRKLQTMGHLPSNPALFKDYAQYGVLKEIRFAAIEALVEVTKTEHRKEDFDFLLILVETDPLISVRHEVIRLLTLNPPFTVHQVDNPLNTPELVDRIWHGINNVLAFDCQLRCGLLDLYYVLFGKGRPPCLPKSDLMFTFSTKNSTTSIINNQPDITTDLPYGAVPVDDQVDKRKSFDEIIRQPLPPLDTNMEIPSQREIPPSFQVEHQPMLSPVDVPVIVPPQEGVQEASHPPPSLVENAPIVLPQPGVPVESGLKQKKKKEKDSKKEKKKKKKKHKNKEHKKKSKSRDHKTSEPQPMEVDSIGSVIEQPFDLYPQIPGPSGLSPDKSPLEEGEASDSDESLN